MTTIRFILVGGFLGAGKTSTIARLARLYEARGLKVGVVTNDQATDLVDTQTLRAQGFKVGEVAGSCFCCNFNALTNAAEDLCINGTPDVILAEPVGSCTDLVATVVQPMMQLFGLRFDVAPYGVILKPSHGKKILSGTQGGFSPKAQYIFKKQLEEADFIIINRSDELAKDRLDELTSLVATQSLGVPVLRTSAKTGAGFETLLEMLEQRGDFGRRILDIDYDIYAEGEAELGWLNMSTSVSSQNAFSLDNLLVDIVDKLRQSLAANDVETAHLKTIGLREGFSGVANLIASDLPAVLSLASGCYTKTSEVFVNARVAMAPEDLQLHVESALKSACERIDAAATVRQTQSFRPGRPVPTHRMTVAT